MTQQNYDHNLDPPEDLPEAICPCGEAILENGDGKFRCSDMTCTWGAFTDA